jgi:hypothetical protein
MAVTNEIGLEVNAEKTTFISCPEIRIQKKIKT